MSTATKLRKSPNRFDKRTESPELLAARRSGRCHRFAAIRPTCDRDVPSFAAGRQAEAWNLEFVGTSNFDQDLWRKSAQAFEGIAFFTGGGGNLSGEGPVQRVRGAQVTWNLLDVLGLKPALGRSFTAADDKPGAPDVLMLSNALWRTAFQADTGIIG